jgi:hypothetical protein
MQATHTNSSLFDTINTISSFRESEFLVKGTDRMNILIHFCGSHGVSLPAPIVVFEGMQIILVIYNFNRDCHMWFWNFKFMPML